MNDQIYLLKNIKKGEESDYITKDTEYCLKILDTEFYFELDKIEDNIFKFIIKYNSGNNLYCNTVTIDTNEQTIISDKNLEKIKYFVYDGKDNSINIYINNSLMNEQLKGFYVNAINCREISKVYFMREGNISFGDSVNYVNKRIRVIEEKIQIKEEENNVTSEKKVINIKPYTNLKYIKKYNKGKLSMSKVREIIRLYYESDNFTTSALAKKFRYSISTIERALSKMNYEYTMKDFYISRKRNLDNNERTAICVYKNLRLKNNEFKQVDLDKYCEDNNCNDRVYEIVSNIIDTNKDNPYIYHLLKYAKDTGWL